MRFLSQTLTLLSGIKGFDTPIGIGVLSVLIAEKEINSTLTRS